MNHKGEAANVAELAGRMQQARFNRQFANNVFKVGIRQLFAGHIQCRENHGLNGVGADDVVEQRW